MKKTFIPILGLVVGLAVTLPDTGEAQTLKKLKKKLEDRVEERVTDAVAETAARKAAEAATNATEKALSGSAEEQAVVGAATDNPRVLLCRSNGECGDSAISRKQTREELEKILGPPAETVGPDPYVVCAGPKRGRCGWTSVPPGDIELVLDGDGVVDDTSGSPDGMEFFDLFPDDQDHLAEEEMRFSEDEVHEPEDGMSFTEEETEDDFAKLCRRDPSFCNFRDLREVELMLPHASDAVDEVPSGSWTVFNKPSTMICTGMTVPIDSSRDRGEFVVSSGGARVKAIGFQAESDVIFQRRYAGVYSGQVKVTQDRVPVTINLAFAMTSKTSFDGLLTSVVHESTPSGPMACKMVRRFSGTRDG